MRKNAVLLVLILAGCVGSKQLRVGESTVLLDTSNEQSFPMETKNQEVEVKILDETQAGTPVRQVTIPPNINRGYQAQLQYKLPFQLKKGDFLVAEISLRGKSKGGAPAMAQFNLERFGKPWTKSIEFTIYPQSKWQTWKIPFTVAEDYAPNESQINLRLGHENNRSIHKNRRCPG